MFEGFPINLGRSLYNDSTLLHANNLSIIFEFPCLRLGGFRNFRPDGDSL